MQTIFEYQKEGSRENFKKIVLLSASPRRKELLKFLNPHIATVDIDEREIEKKYLEKFKNDSFLEQFAKVCCEISKAKSNTYHEEDTLYISADTVVLSDNKIFNKPVDKKEAKSMLLSYFGKSHYVITSVCLRMKNYLEVFYSVAKIDFVDYYEELEEVIDTYIAEKIPLDKSGAYGIQELDPRLVKSITGDINTIVGLPVAELSYRLFSNKN